MTHRLGRTMLYFSLAVGFLCLTLMLQGLKRHMKGHLSLQKCLAATCSSEVSHFKSPFLPQCACELGCADTGSFWAFSHCIQLLELALCADNISKLMISCLLEFCLGHATCLARCCWKDSLVNTEETKPCKLPHVTQRKGLLETLPHQRLQHLPSVTSVRALHWQPACVTC